MALYLNTNLSALQAKRSVNSATTKLDKAYENLSSGLKINSAKDDPAGVQTSDRLTVQLNSLNQTNRNAQNAIAYAQTAEGAMEEELKNNRYAYYLISNQHVAHVLAVCL